MPFSRLRGARVLPLTVSLGTVFVLGVAHLPEPVTGDQALYQLGARAMRDGAVLYRDFWDLKQPGVYAFHYLAGRLLGFGEVGLHAFELAVMLGLALLLALGLRGTYARPWLAYLVPITSVGAYYTAVGNWHLTQPAILASVPLFICLWCVTAPWRSRRGAAVAWVVAGLAGAVAMTIKMVVAPIVIAFAVAALALPAEPAAWRGRRLERVAAGLLGLCLVLGPAFAWFWSRGAHLELLSAHTSWRDAAASLQGAPPIRKLLGAGFWFTVRFAPWLLLAAFTPLAWRGPGPERMVLQAVLWLVVGFGTIVGERFAWWPFDFLLLAIPVGMLAVRGLDGVLASEEARRGWSPRVQQCLAAGLTLLALVPGLVRWKDLAAATATGYYRGDPFAVDEKVYQRARDAGYQQVWEETAFLRDTARSAPGPVYVFGDPVYVLLAGRPQATRLHGWAWELQPESMWRELQEALERERPPYIYVDRHHRTVIRERAPGLAAWLERDFVPDRGSARGTWWVRRDVAGAGDLAETPAPAGKVREQ